MAFHLVVYLVGESETAVIHRQQESFYLQFLVQFAFYYLDGVQQFADTLEREVFALHRNDDRVGSRERVHRYQSQRRAAVNQYVVVFVAYGFEQLLYHLLPVVQVEHLYLGSHKVDVARYYVKSVYVGRVDGVAHVGVVDDTLIEGAVHFLYVNSESARCVCLRIGVNDENSLFQSSKRGGKIYCRGCLTYAAFLISQCNNFSHLFLCFIRCTKLVHTSRYMLGTQSCIS